MAIVENDVSACVLKSCFYVVFIVLKYFTPTFSL